MKDSDLMIMNAETKFCDLAFVKGGGFLNDDNYSLAVTK